MDLFEDMRRQRSDWYTANPLDAMTDEQLARLAEQEGITVAELRQAAAVPKVASTCPLCGRPSTHLVGCKGCGGGAWGFELEEAYGPHVVTWLRTALGEALAAGGYAGQPVDAAMAHAYVMGGCMVCADCWEHTLPGEAFRICPLFLLHERTLKGDLAGRVMARWTGQDPEEWAAQVRAHWLVNWNTVVEREVVAAWRGTVLKAAMEVNIGK